MNEREQIVCEARSMIGAPFLHRGRSRLGIDCAGLVILARNAALSPAIDEQDYPPHPTPQKVFGLLNRHARRVTKEDAGPGDVVVVKWGPRVSHLGILTALGIVHASRTDGKVVENPIGCMNAVAWYRWMGVAPWRS
jgi:murein DD-endopeptidase / murein LD-carboxypeptidase